METYLPVKLCVFLVTSVFLGVDSLIINTIDLKYESNSKIMK